MILNIRPWCALTSLQDRSTSGAWSKTATLILPETPPANSLTDSIRAVKRYVSYSNVSLRLYSQTNLYQPYVYDEEKELMIAFDDRQSFAAKGEFILKTGLGGFAMWEAGGDHNDILLDSIRQAAGLGSEVEC